MLSPFHRHHLNSVSLNRGNNINNVPLALSLVLYLVVLFTFLFPLGGCELANNFEMPNLTTDCPARDPNEPKISIYLLTWNVMGGSPRDVESAFQFEKGLKDVYGIALQESPFELIGDQWKVELDRIFGIRNYVRLHSFRPVLLGIQTALVVYIRREDITKYFEFSYDYKWLNLGGKASIGIRFYFSNLAICFVGSHFDAHDYNLRKRVANYHDTVKAIEFDKDGKGFFTNKDPKDGILKQDLIFWFGDLNFRLDQLPIHWTFADIVHRARVQQYKELLMHDQLKQKMAQKEVFEDFEEEEIKFAPTFKFYPDDYNLQQSYNPKRTPSYTDRVLHRNNLLLNARKNYRIKPECEDNFKYQVIEYDSLNIRWSDHRPVYALVHVPVSLDNQARKMRIKSYRRKRAISNYLQHSSQIEEPTLSPARSLSIQFVPIASWRLDHGHNPLVAYFNIKDKTSNDLLTANDAKVKSSLSQWDWVGLYKDNFVSIEDYIVFAYPKFEGWVEQAQDAMDLLAGNSTEETWAFWPPPRGSRRGSAEERRAGFAPGSSPLLPTSLDRDNSRKSRSRLQSPNRTNESLPIKSTDEEELMSSQPESTTTDEEPIKTEASQEEEPTRNELGSSSRSSSLSSLSSLTDSSQTSNDSRASTRSIGEGSTNLFSAMFDDDAILLPGRYVLLYVRSNGDVLGVSEAFDIVASERSAVFYNDFEEENEPHRRHYQQD